MSSRRNTTQAGFVSIIDLSLTLMFFGLLAMRDISPYSEAVANQPSASLEATVDSPWVVAIWAAEPPGPVFYRSLGELLEGRSPLDPGVVQEALRCGRPSASARLLGEPRATCSGGILVLTTHLYPFPGRRTQWEGWLRNSLGISEDSELSVVAMPGSGFGPTAGGLLLTVPAGTSRNEAQ